jgi:ABC-2 type transport system ATP-binding protein
VATLIEVNNISKKYKDGTKALSKVSFRIDKGITAIIGRNGAGKTTLMRILSTQLMPTSGTATIEGKDVVTEPNEVRKTICSIPQEVTPLGTLTPYEHILIYLLARGFSIKEARLRSDRIIKETNIKQYRDKTADELSGGTKRKIFVGMALASGADVIFLDEPTTGLDPISRIEVWNYIRKFKGTVVLTTHYMEEAKELAERIIMIDSGRVIAQGSTSELMAKYKGLVRIEGVKVGSRSYKVGGIYISYIKKEDAKRYVGTDVTIKKFDIEDLFVMKGVSLSEEEEPSKSEW